MLTKEDITNLIDELCNRSTYNLGHDAMVYTNPKFIEKFLDDVNNILHDYYSNHEVPL